MEGMKVKLANPAPLGLICFGMTTILLNEHNAGIFGLSVVIVSMGIAIGGLAQIIAGIFELKQGNTFGGTAFTAYGFFWISLVLIWLNPGDKVAGADPKSMGFYLALWGVFTLFMFICTLRHNRAIQFVFATLTILFFGLAIGDFTGVREITIVSGIIGIICGASAVYTSMAIMLKEEYGREILRICEVGEKKKD
jgi:succinate-acetate transporter protein